MRVKITLAYNGTHFFGSQVQSETDQTILGLLELSLSKLGIKERVVASGRTDRGVHATGQVCHVDLPLFWSDLTKLRQELNRSLPLAIRVKKITAVSEDFHARYSAKKRSYRYIIKEGEADPFSAEFITYLDSYERKKVEENIALFVGEYDFSYFLKSGSETKSNVREIYKAYAYRYKGYSILHFQATGFLRSQIRLMVGALLSLNSQEIQEKLTLVKNHNCRPAPANGLYLAKILY